MNRPKDPTDKRETSAGVSVLSFNIHKGFGFVRNFTIEHTKAALKALDVDMICLQEVQGKHSRKAKKFANWPDGGHLEYLADSIWPHYAYGKNAVYQAGHHGNAILSQQPILESYNLKMNRTPFFSRSLLYANLVLHGRSVHVISMHLSITQVMRSLQLQHVGAPLHQILASEDPVILAGDTNDPRNRFLKNLQQDYNLVDCAQIIHGRELATFPAFKPTLPLDRIYTRGFTVDSIEALDFQPWNQLSDHLPVLCRMKL